VQGKSRGYLKKGRFYRGTDSGIAACLDSLRSWVRGASVVDSGSRIPRPLARRIRDRPRRGRWQSSLLQVVAPHVSVESSDPNNETTPFGGSFGVALSFTVTETDRHGERQILREGARTLRRDA
jgi:hypothetical protein